jgi:hypothetical protein
MYHGIIIGQEFTDKFFPNTFKIFDQKQDGGWIIYGIEIEDQKLDEAIVQVQNNLKIDQPWYAHLYNDHSLIVIFKGKVFKVNPHVSSWKPIIDYGTELNIPKEQLDFWPNRFQDEIHYFAKN